MEPSTAEPVDTMNLGSIPLVVKKEEESEEEEEADQNDLRLMLFPSQIHKISNLIGTFILNLNVLLIKCATQQPFVWCQGISGTPNLL